MELFAGGSYAEAGLFNTGHWVGCPGWDASLGLNLTHWLGFIVDGGQYFGTSKNSRGYAGAIFPPTLPAQSALVPPSMWTPVNTMFFLAHNFPAANMSGGRRLACSCGHHAHARRGESSHWPTRQRSELRPGAGGGRRPRLQNQSTFRLTDQGGLLPDCNNQFSLLEKKKQDNFRFSVGIVIHSVHKKKRRLEDETQVEP